ncbi:MAG: hypothetical protein LBV34_04535 [Nocardiopsaceae bacterium]|jgi:hypothetical protein|nr:hypothetical protein [Nocardiopsaceae bacterium]
MGAEESRLGTRMWVLGNVVAFTIGGALSGALLRSLQEPYFTVVTSAGAAAGIGVWTVGVSSAIFGAILGAGQTWAIRGFPAAAWWLPATCLGWAVTGAAVGALSGVAGGSVSTIGPATVPAWIFIVSAGAGVLVGLVPGLPQWLLLRRHATSAAWWPALNLLGVATGFGCGFLVVRLGLVELVPLLRPEDFPSGKALTLVGVVAGTVYALVTGRVLAKALSR